MSSDVSARQRLAELEADVAIGEGHLAALRARLGGRPPSAADMPELARMMALMLALLEGLRARRAEAAAEVLLAEGGGRCEAPRPCRVMARAALAEAMS